MKLIAHRGISALAPENTVSAFSLALARGVYGIELDVQLSKDGIPIVTHDSSIKRVTGIDKNVHDLTARELSSINNGLWFNKKFSKDTFITLNQTLDMINTNAKVLIEIKGTKKNRQELTEEVCEIIDKRKVADWVEVLSSSSDTLKHASKVLKSRPILRHLIYFNLYPITPLRFETSYINAYNINYIITPFLSNAIKKAGKKLSIGAAPKITQKAFKKWNQLGVEALMRNDPTPFL